jgi:hypothetical protein
MRVSASTAVVDANPAAATSSCSQHNQQQSQLRLLHGVLLIRQVFVHGGTWMAQRGVQ